MPGISWRSFFLPGISWRSWKSLENQGVQNRLGPAQTGPELDFPPIEMDSATTNGALHGALQEAAPGRPELPYEPDQNGRKSGRGGLGRKMALDPTGGAQEKPPRIASGHFGEGGDHRGSPVPPALRRKIPEKEVKNTDFHSPPGCDLCRQADPRVLAPLFLNYARSSLAQE